MATPSFRDSPTKTASGVFRVRGRRPSRQLYRPPVSFQVGAVALDDRIRIADKSVQRIASLRGIQRVTGGIGLWIGLAPDGALMILREIQGSEIYAWDWVER